ncbi:MAG: exodeoxyribonuclease VII large subunit [Albidovulum sp.]|nr:exodeoxyribonuclease VII large subunit [Albidovulum sp.]MDE0529846.1 exodeoxyribonuclease VII large subunit [Albidovulum sp.]
MQEQFLSKSNVVDNVAEYTIAEISRRVKDTVEENFGRVRVRGEVARVSRPRSGHLYLTFKQDSHSLDAVIWRSTAQRLPKLPEEGIEYLATGKLTTFSGNSRYQMIVERIERAGKGALLEKLEELKAKLLNEGLFEDSRKKPLPVLPEVIGVVTSPTGSVIRDILHRLRDRFPRRVLVWPVAVQGESCAKEVAAAIQGFNGLEAAKGLPRPDLIIIARGGGSVEDLWGFNEEVVSRAVFRSSIPVISAVGHETDTTLIDYVADVRAPTPTAAAEMAVPVRLDIAQKVISLSARISASATRNIARKKQRLEDLARLLPKTSTLVATSAQRLDFATSRLSNSVHAALQVRRLSVARLQGGLRPSRSTQEARRKFDRLSDRLGTNFSEAYRRHRYRYRAVAPHLNLRLLERSIRENSRRIGEVSSIAIRAFSTKVIAKRAKVENLDRLRNSLGYRQTLQRGFTVIRTREEVVKSKKIASSATDLEIEFYDGRLDVRRI